LKIKPGDTVIDFTSGNVFKVKYLLGDKVVVNNGIYDFPLFPEEYAIYSPLMEELI
jgi:hypothetical protein